jgi:hypothetical protein
MAQAHPNTILTTCHPERSAAFRNAKRDTESKDPYSLQDSRAILVPELCRNPHSRSQARPASLSHATNQFSDLSINPASSIFNFFNPSLGR